MKATTSNLPQATAILRVARALNHPLRRRLLDYLLRHPARSVMDIYKEHHLQQSVASQQLGILRKAGLVMADRDGKSVRYRVNKERLRQVERIEEELSL